MANASINAHIEQAIHSIETEREQQIASRTAIVMQEKVAPKNTEIDTARDRALQALQTKLNDDISTLQEKFATERQSIIDASEQQKADNAHALITAETASIAYEYNTKISELKKLIEA